jgi:membrane carboxypeptidase/penicillin-binding protein PbpC
MSKNGDPTLFHWVGTPNQKEKREDDGTVTATLLLNRLQKHYLEGIPASSLMSSR